MVAGADGGLQKQVPLSRIHQLHEDAAEPVQDRAPSLRRRSTRSTCSASIGIRFSHTSGRTIWGSPNI